MYLQKSRQAYTKNPVHDGKFRLVSILITASKMALSDEVTKAFPVCYRPLVADGRRDIHSVCAFRWDTFSYTFAALR